MNFRGTFTALVTPFTKDGSAVDVAALERLVEAQVKGGVSGLVPCGTAGEDPLLSDEDRRNALRCIVSTASGRVPVIAGVGSIATATSVHLTRHAIDAGADGVMVVMPPYLNPSQEGMRAHVLEVARSTDRPVMLYNNPARSGVDLHPDTFESICEAAPNVVAVKESTGDIMRCQELHRRLGDRLAV